MSDGRSWILTDGGKRVWVESLELGPRELGIRGFPGVSVRKRVLRGGLSDGVDIVEVNNGELSFSVVPTRGMGIWRGEYRGCAIGWEAPVVGPVNPAFVDLESCGGLGWLWGFDECIVRCGLESNGAPGTDLLPTNTGELAERPITLHGRIANIPAHRVEIQVIPGDPPEICVRGTVDESRLFCPQLRLITRISTKAGSNALTIADEILNMRSTSSEAQILYHCNFGKPFMEEGARMVLPASETAPRDARAAEGIDTWAEYRGPTPGFVEQAYWHKPLGDRDGNSVALLRNAAGDKGVAVRFNVGQLPCFTQWKNTGAESDGYVTGLEPGANYPNMKIFERKKGRVLNLAAGQKYRADLTMEVHADTEGVRGVEREIAAIQGKTAHRIHKQPRPGYSAIGK